MKRNILIVSALFIVGALTVWFFAFSTGADSRVNQTVTEFCDALQDRSAAGGYLVNEPAYVKRRAFSDVGEKNGDGRKETASNSYEPGFALSLNKEELVTSIVPDFFSRRSEV